MWSFRPHAVSIGNAARQQVPGNDSHHACWHVTPRSATAWNTTGARWNTRFVYATHVHLLRGATTQLPSRSSIE